MQGPGLSGDKHRGLCVVQTLRMVFSREGSAWLKAPVNRVCPEKGGLPSPRKCEWKPRMKHLLCLHRKPRAMPSTSKCAAPQLVVNTVVFTFRMGTLENLTDANPKTVPEALSNVPSQLPLWGLADAHKTRG